MTPIEFCDLIRQRPHLLERWLDVAIEMRSDPHRRWLSASETIERIRHHKLDCEVPNDVKPYLARVTNRYFEGTSWPKYRLAASVADELELADIDALIGELLSD